MVQSEQHVIYRLMEGGRVKLTWKKLTEKDCREWKLTIVDPSRKEKLEIRCEICSACS